MSNYGYGGRQNPYDQRDPSPAQGNPPYPTGGYNAYGAPPQQQYGRQNQYNAPAMGRDEYSAGQNVEMEPLAPNGSQFGRNGNSILDQVGEINIALRDINQSLMTLGQKQQRVLADTDTSPNAESTRQLDAASADILNQCRDLVERVRRIKSKPEANSSANKAQVGSVERKVQAAMQDYQRKDAEYRRKLVDQMARQYRIVDDTLTEQESRAAAEAGDNTQIFAQATMQSGRSQRANDVASAVRSRHNEIQKIARQMEELAQLFNDMENLVVQQEAAVTNIEMKGEEVVENMDKGTEQIGVAVKSARNARKWKWWCLGICVAIIIVIVIIVLLYQFVFGPNAKSNRDATKQKRFVLPPSLTNSVIRSAKPFDSTIPGLEWTSNNKLVRKTRPFQA